MKKLTTFAVGLLVIVFFVPVSGQQCDYFFLQNEGAVMEYTHFNKKDKPTGKNVQKISHVNSSGGATTADITSEMYDKKDNLTFSSEMKVRCTGEGFYVSMENYLAEESMAGFRDMDVKLEGDDLLIPASLNVGDVLPGGELKVTISGPTMPRMTMTIEVGERKVEAKEKITTSAGTFDCFKISYETETQMLMTIKTKSTEWFSQKVGQVKTENYSSGGKLTSYTLLTKIEK